jgi:DNA-binding transcriptional LysR family regulator
MPSPIIVEVNNAEWGINLVENGDGVGLYHIKSVARPIAEGRLKILPLTGDILVGVEAILRTDAPRNPMADKFISLVKQTLENKPEKATPKTVAVNTAKS